jgi:hypothetical protein
LNTHWFTTLRQARSIIESWRIDYNYGPYCLTSLCA